MKIFCALITAVTVSVSSVAILANEKTGTEEIVKKVETVAFEDADFYKLVALHAGRNKFYPLKTVAGHLGYELFDLENGNILTIAKDNEVIFTEEVINSVKTNIIHIPTDTTSPVLVNGRIYVTSNFISEVLNCELHTNQ